MKIQRSNNHRLTALTLTALPLLTTILLTGCGMPENTASGAGAGQTLSTNQPAKGLNELLEAFGVKTETTRLTREEAVQIALQAAGVKEADAIFDDKEYDSDDGRAEYEIEFWANNIEYEYDIDAMTGEILREKKKEKKAPALSNATADQLLSKEEAISIALQAAGVTEEQALFEDRDFDLDDGKVKYEIEFYVGRTEYEYDIDAVTGEILREKKKEHQAPSSTTNTTQAPSSDPQPSEYLTRERAIALALTHAGVTEADARIEEAEFDIDDGRAEYSVEFRADGYEYEYDIDALTGEIIQFDKEWDD